MVEFCLFNPLQAFVSCVAMVFEVTVCGVAVHIIFNVEVCEVDGCSRSSKAINFTNFMDLMCFRLVMSVYSSYEHNSS